MLSYIRVCPANNDNYWIEYTRSFCPRWRETYHFQSHDFFSDVLPTETLSVVLKRLKSKGYIISYGRRADNGKYTDTER